MEIHLGTKIIVFCGNIHLPILLGSFFSKRGHLMSENIELFKTRLAQLKKVLERDGKIAEELFYKAMQLDKSEDLKKEVMGIIANHKFKIKKGYIELPSETGDREAQVREFFRETFDYLVKAFGFDMSELVTKEPQPPKSASALKLFEMQDELSIETETGTQAFESTMQELDTIDTSIPLESLMNDSQPVDDGTTETSNSEQVSTEEIGIIPESVPEEIEEPAPPEQITQSEEKPILQKPKPRVSPALVKTNIVPEVSRPPVAEITYIYYVCSRCGAEISKKDMKQSGSYLECPSCHFTFSQAEATVIQKKFGSQDKASPRKIETLDKIEPEIEQAKQGESFDLFSDKGDESLVRPSDLFRNNKDAFASAPKKDVISKQSLQPHEKPRKPVPGDRLIRPSEYLGQMQENVAAEENTIEHTIIPESVPEENKPPVIESSANQEPSVQEDLKARAVPSIKRKTVEKPKPVSREPQLQKVAKPVKTNHGPKENRVIGDHLVKPSERLVRPSELREIAMEKKDAEEKCPRCGSTKFTKIQDRSKIVSYNPLMYGSRKKCTACSLIFD